MPMYSWGAGTTIHAFSMNKSTTTSTYVKKSNKKSNRPTPLTKSLASNASTEAIVNEDTASESEKTLMAASFLQYCATCEKQIGTPNNSVLYCSEACRRKDSRKPLALAASAKSPTTSPTPSAPSSPRPILAPRIPTGASYASTTSTRIPPELHDTKSDLDPTEWKPRLHRRGESDAFRYLTQFHRSTSALSTGNVTPERPFGHRSTTNFSSMGVPSLVQTPMTAATSLSTSAEYHGQPYDLNTRPLQLRHNPMDSASAGTIKSIDLVMPHFAPMDSAVATDDGKESWAKRFVTKPVQLAGQEGLGALLGGEAPN